MYNVVYYIERFHRDSVSVATGSVRCAYLFSAEDTVKKLEAKPEVKWAIITHEQKLYDEKA